MVSPKLVDIWLALPKPSPVAEPAVDLHCSPEYSQPDVYPLPPPLSEKCQDGVYDPQSDMSTNACLDPNGTRLGNDPDVRLGYTTS